MERQRRPRIVIIGAGFGGLHAARQFVKEDVDVLLIDRNNFHTFTPLLYQVATCALDSGEIAYPVRGIFRDKANISFLMGEVTTIDTNAQTVRVRVNGTARIETYDKLIVAAGSVTNFFGMDTVQQYSFELKDLRDSVTLRNHILKLFEKAAWAEDPTYRQALSTIVVVGGGPTGIETAGAIRELYAHVLHKEYANTPGMQLEPRVILVEMTDALLRPYPPKLQAAALRQLESLGVDVRLNTALKDAAKDHVILGDDSIIPTYTLIWSAGVKAAPVGELLNVPLQRGARVPVKPTMAVENLDNVYVVGDMAYLEDENGMPYPMIIPIAQQQGILAAKNILRGYAGQEPEHFTYSSRGIMATIGRSRAVAWIYHRIQLTGYLAWAAWLVLHLVELMGFRNRLNVLINWTWNYITYDRSVRLIEENTIDDRADTIEKPEVLPVEAEVA
ncbi:MAG: NAD(P)/FAD-dependent oxidoreductase [Chloroflexi bacterium]|nr:NAD(P)/FAD-dependent oxidoreductase [Chloroflexota bacterium]